MRRVLEVISIAICIFLNPALGFAQGATSTLVMVTFVNNANPPGLITTSQTIIGSAYTNCDEAAKKAIGITPDKNALQSADPLKLYFVCVPNSSSR